MYSCLDMFAILRESSRRNCACGFFCYFKWKFI